MITVRPAASATGFHPSVAYCCSVAARLDDRSARSCLAIKPLDRGAADAEFSS